MDAKFRMEYMNALETEVNKFLGLQQLHVYAYQEFQGVQLRLRQAKIAMMESNGSRDGDKLSNEAFVRSVGPVYSALTIYFVKILERFQFHDASQRAEFEKAFLRFRDAVSQKLSSSQASVYKAGLAPPEDSSRYATDAVEKLNSLFSRFCFMHEMVRKLI